MLCCVVSCFVFCLLFLFFNVENRLKKLLNRLLNLLTAFVIYDLKLFFFSDKMKIVKVTIIGLYYEGSLTYLDCLSWKVRVDKL